jgi:beta-glucosidase
MNSKIDERTRFELYYPPFEGAIEANVGSVMCSSNQVNGNFSCGNDQILNQDLRDRLGFKGYVMSDWEATHNLTNIHSGLDVEMPGGHAEKNMSDAVLNQNDLKNVSTKDIENSVYRYLKSAIGVGVFDKNNTGKLEANATSSENKKVAEELAAEGFVLLKNDENALPLRNASVGRQNLLMIGDSFHGMTVGNGTSFV